MSRCRGTVATCIHMLSWPWGAESEESSREPRDILCFAVSCEDSHLVSERDSLSLN
jgi:hypothetical protein